MGGANNRVLAGALAGVVVGMTGLSFAAVPLYRAFCQVTGYGGTTQRAAGVAGRVLDRTVTVTFNADTDRGLPWAFRPEVQQVRLRLGEPALIHYRAENHAAETMVGTAVFNVTPEKAGVHFNKIDCFCFQEQTLEPGQAAGLPVYFFVDPALADDPDLADITTITLSYTFYRAGPRAGGGQATNSASNRG